MALEDTAARAARRHGEAAADVCLEFDASAPMGNSEQVVSISEDRERDSPL